GEGPRVAFSAELLHDLGHRYSAQIRAPAHAQGRSLCRSFTVADHEHVGNLAELGVADLGVHAVAAAVHFDTQAVRLELSSDLLRVGQVAVRNGNDHRLCRREPERKVAFVFLNEEGHHALHSRDDATVYHNRPGSATVLCD